MSEPTVLVTGIGELVTNDPESEQGDGTALGMLSDAAVVVQEGRVAWVGTSCRAPGADRAVDLDGRAVLPGFVDTHTHLVFAGDRCAEFSARMAGERYDGGGIASTVAATRASPDSKLRALVARRIAELRSQGTTTVEIKGGYELTVDGEARALRLASEFTTETTFLGAHVVPPEFAGRPHGIPRPRDRPDACRCCPPRAMGGRVLRAGESARVRRRRVEGGP